MSYFSKRALRWAAPVALVGALGLAACGDNDDTEAVRVAAPSVAGLGSDQHLANQAEELARASASAGSDQHLNNQAAELARAQRANAAATARLAGLAEQQAHLDGNAETYGNLSANAANELAEEQGAAQANAAPRTDAGLCATCVGAEVAHPNAFEAGNRAALQAQAEDYVQQQQDRAESNRVESNGLVYGYVDPRADDANSTAG
jgi:hypothetical protein